MPDPTPLADRLEADMKGAMRARDKLRLDTIRRARAGLKNAEIAARGPIDEAGAERVLRGIVKQHRESIEQFRAAGREDLAGREEAEMAIIEAYLPTPPDAEAVEAAVREAIAAEEATGPGDMGRVMKAAMARLGASADGREVSDAARRLLSSA